MDSINSSASSSLHRSRKARRSSLAPGAGALSEERDASRRRRCGRAVQRQRRRVARADRQLRQARRRSLRVEEQTRAANTEPDLWLVFAPIKRARIDYLVEKATELGASALVPVITRAHACRAPQSRSPARACDRGGGAERALDRAATSASRARSMMCWRIGMRRAASCCVTNPGRRRRSRLRSRGPANSSAAVRGPC